MARLKTQKESASRRLRLAVISTPRSGNTWVRMQLASLYGLEHFSVHHPEDVDWENLPERCVLQIHWYPIDPFLECLDEHEFRVVVLARHPMDVLMSWLNLAISKHADLRCPGGGACTECAIVNASPGSAEFVEYVRSYSGKVLLCYSPAWWNRPGILRARYEDLLADPEFGLQRLAELIGAEPVRPISEVVAAHSLQEMKVRSDVWRYHCWQGQSGLWKHFVPAEAARAMRDGVPQPFEMLDYHCDPDESLTTLQAEYNWSRVQLDSARDQLARAHHKLDRALKELAEERRAHDEIRRALAEARNQPPEQQTSVINN